MDVSCLTASHTPSRERWLLAGLLVVFGLVSVQYYLKIDDEQRSAILRWRPQIQQLDEVNIYEQFTYPNPPIMALLLRPLTALPPVATGLVWFYLKVLLTLAAIAWAFRLVETADRPYPLAAKALAVLLTLRPILGDLTHGNVNLFILFLVVAALYAYREGFDVLGGLVLALAIACKVTPALFLPYLLWKRAGRTLAGCAGGLVLFLFIIPGLFLGMERNRQLLASWYDCMVRPYVAAGAVTTDHLNQSLPAQVYRWITPSPSTVSKGIPTEYSNVAALDPFWARTVVRSCMAGFAAVVVWSCRTPTRPRHGWRLSAEFGLILLGMLLFSERTWKHHCVTLLLPFAVICYVLWTAPSSRALRAYLAATLAGATLLMTTTASGLGASWDQAAKLAHADGAYVWAYLLLAAALVVLLRRRTGLDNPSRVDIADGLVTS
jgi:hypothetical protein